MPDPGDGDQTPAEPTPVDGEPAASPADAPAPTASPPTGPMPSAAMPPITAPKAGWRSFGVLIGIGLALVLAVGTTLVFTLIGGGVSGAENRVLSYYERLSEKDGKGARKLLEDVDGDVYEDEGIELADFLAESPLWASKTLKRGYQPPTDVEVVYSAPAPPSGVERHRDREYALVTVAYNLGNRPATETFGLERASRGGWRIISAAIGGFALPDTESFRIDVAGHDDAKASDGDVCPDCGNCEDCEATFSLWGVLAPPGRYDIAISEHGVFEDVKSTLDIAPGLDGLTGTDFSISTLDFKVRDGVKADAESQVKDVIDECAREAEQYYVDTECPWGDDESVEVSDAADSWDVTAYPEFTIVAGYDGSALVETVKPGEATATDAWDDEPITAELTVDGELVEDDGEIVWIPDEF